MKIVKSILFLMLVFNFFTYRWIVFHNINYSQSIVNLRDNDNIYQLINKISPILATMINDANYAIWVLIIYGIWKSLPFNIIMLTTALLKINNQYYQAAAIDGMRKSKQLFKVTVPLVIPILILLKFQKIMIKIFH